MRRRVHEELDSLKEDDALEKRKSARNATTGGCIAQPIKAPRSGSRRRRFSIASALGINVLGSALF